MKINENKLRQIIKESILNEISWKTAQQAYSKAEGNQDYYSTQLEYLQEAFDALQSFCREVDYNQDDMKLSQFKDNIQANVLPMLLNAANICDRKIKQVDNLHDHYNQKFMDEFGDTPENKDEEWSSKLSSDIDDPHEREGYNLFYK